MLGPYTARNGRMIAYRGNERFEPIDDVSRFGLRADELCMRVSRLATDDMWPTLTRITDCVLTSVAAYLREIGCLLVPVPLTTRMISSPGAVYGREAISYTTDTCPITLEWFDLKDRAYLSESSQIYLELALMQSGVDRVCASYNSFRKEEADATHLSEFHHVEFEGHVSQDENLDIIGAMLYRAVADVIRDCPRELATFIGDDRIAELSDTFARPIPRIAFKDVLDELYKATRHDLYREFTLKHFGPWEEVLITEIIGGPVAILDMPLYEVPFYHAQKRGTEAPIADNADVIWPGYRETVGSGHRVGTLAELEHKASKFDLPRDDYEPYLSSRRSPKYEQSSGFGMGLERLLHGMLELPYIHYATLFPRVHVSLTP